MVLVSETEFKRASGVGLKKQQAIILGEIALRGSVSEREILSLVQERGLLEELLRRKIIKREPNHAYKLGEFGPGHCHWIWGARGKPREGKKQIERKTREKKKIVKPGKRKTQSKKRVPKPHKPRSPRNADYEARKRQAIERYRRRFRP